MTHHLVVEGLCAGYGDLRVLHDVGLSVPAGSVVAIVGANGAGKSTLLSTIAGLIRPSAGRLTFRGSDITRARAEDLPALGLALVPEGGRLFPFMTVEENLQLGAYSRHARAGMAGRIREVTAAFPILTERRTQLAGKLSGGERQMCAIARALMCRPSLLLLDEPSVGLSPLMAETVLQVVAGLARDEGLTVVIVEQRVTEVLEIADEAHILDQGRIVRSGQARQFLADRSIQEAYMGL
ncbi:ABC transporter ATP-binding protein [Bosea sp. SSUT16]|jgi:branched-chain amino acid transport system ATP-binding protein|uniref:ABC transporter ATP-binding protein n=1 Tax=Bosea spartocytisi TaxID=2773451 RepID=A0A927EC53_9HYPH|nr:ABC transporter ATP-binding protein [Bosea spartocytisi]MBD3848109.1 ABC transporter ATP-binding protein [Bosea spartocytisi]MCT4473960.1 ABC transporter ATP-binding protein [Bosea spartocytisi]